MILSTAVRIARLNHPVLLSPSPSSPLRRHTVGFRVGAQPEPPAGDMEKPEAPKPAEVTADVMSESFGEGYATRSDEEGFGGIYSGNQTLGKQEEHDQLQPPTTHPDFDKTQGSEVKEKEKSRHQTEANC